MTDWKARAEREAAAILTDTYRLGSFVSYERLVDLMAVAWLQGNIAGSHETLAEHERAFEELRAALA